MMQAGNCRKPSSVAYKGWFSLNSFIKEKEKETRNSKETRRSLVLSLFFNIFLAFPKRYFAIPFIDKRNKWKQYNPPHFIRAILLNIGGRNL